VCDRLERFHEKKGREWKKGGEGSPARARGRPVRDRVIVFVLLSTGLRREELIVVLREEKHATGGGPRPVSSGESRYDLAVISGARGSCALHEQVCFASY
jgi:hypothetical protein